MLRFAAFARLKLSRTVKAGSCGVAGTIVSVSVALSLAVFGSVVPAGAATVAVLASVPVADADSVVTAVNVALPPLASVTVPVRALPVPVAVQLDPAVAVHVHEFTVSEPGSCRSRSHP